ncbi:MAG: DUF1385 domain-containing protein [Anaerolineales bacterium]|nr:DUF1385 domain-containing protein [Anaerolineales bacterium]
MDDKLIAYGGQAVIEGVLMRGRRACAMANRLPDGSIAVRVMPLGGIYQSRLTKIPFLRGLVLLWDALGLGMRALTDAANLQAGEDERIEGTMLYITLGLTILIAVGIFFLAPAGVGWLTERYLHWGAWGSNLLEGIVRLLLLIGYIWAIGFMPDIRRVFAYHGAEHKTINAYEAGADLTPASVAAFPLAHARCGTAFLLTLVVVSLILFSLLGPLPLEWRFISRILLIPVVAGIAYEYIKWTSSHMDNSLVRAMAAPGLALQRLTTREPDEKMLEVAIAAFQAMRKAEEEWGKNAL